MISKDWRIPGLPTEALRNFLKAPRRLPGELSKLEEAFALDPTEENFNKLKAERERLWALEVRGAKQAG